MGEQMSSLNRSIMHEAALVTNAPIKRLSLYCGLDKPNVPQNISNFPTPQSASNIFKALRFVNLVSQICLLLNGAPQINFPK